MALVEKMITIPVYDHINPNVIRDAFVNELKKAKNKISLSIIDVAEGDEGEIERINLAFIRILYKCAESGSDLITMEDIDKVMGCLDSKGISPRLDNKEASLVECLLSTADFLCDLCFYALRDGAISDAVLLLSNINYLLGLTEGHDKAEAMNEEKRRLIQQYAAQMRHAPSRGHKEKVVQHFKDNYSSFENKDDAAFKMAESIVPEKFATVRGWLKGVNPE